MTRPLPLALLFFVMLVIFMKFGATFMWIVSAIAFLGLIGIIFLMYRRDMYVGPSTLVDDARRVRDRVIRDDGGEAERVQAEAIAAREEMLVEDELEEEAAASALYSRNTAVSTARKDEL